MIRMWSGTPSIDIHSGSKYVSTMPVTVEAWLDDGSLYMFLLQKAIDLALSIHGVTLNYATRPSDLALLSYLYTAHWLVYRRTVSTPFLS